MAYEYHSIFEITDSNYFDLKNVEIKNKIICHKLTELETPPSNLNVKMKNRLMRHIA